ncbi:GntR family transcriptional regulator [Xanthobacter oligotrophicus]|uniref:GntR family transcriptional regulator n=1 Tax=Xanthobacter oligotrophicus TaxID=2607286 RepID=UPI0011F1B59B|nr:GntR family transcriptional regulator [Xanthobacter oligotrophicus]MCG5235633.1 GntR family transcriptional regulator [Xanthobacter oligotrophicus]
MRGEQTPRLREALEEDIVSGRLRPGQRLDEVGLAERFGVSRTPIREALIQLSASGLIEIRPRRGAFVVLLGPRELLESFELMEELEAACARLAAQRMGAADRAALACAHAACGAAVAAGDPSAYYTANAAFHAAIYAATGNRVIHGEALRLQRALRPYRRLQLNVPRRMEASFAEHEAIMAALSAGDGVGAAERMRAHVQVLGERFMALLAALQAQAEASSGSAL